MDEWTSKRAFCTPICNIRYIISLSACQLVHSSIYLLVYSSTYRFILLTNKFHSANGLAVLLHIKHVDACLSKVYVNHVASVELSSLASNLLTSCCVNANLVCTSLSELYYCVLAYCVSLHLCALYSVNASRISHLDYRECLLCLTKSVRECKSYVVVATCAERNVCRTFLTVTSNVSECSVL